MDKNAIKKYAIWARRELIARVTQRALLYGITEKEIVPADATGVNGKLLSAAEVNQRKALIARIQKNGFEQVMEEVAYTWFNRFSALRFMEVNGYLPSHVRVFTDDAGAFKPQILTEAINLELDGLDMEKVYALKDANDEETLFKYLIIVQCNALSAILPGMFQKIDDYTELLFPDNLLREGSAIEQMISIIPEEDWQDQVQIIGWLYQYYNTEPKDRVFANLKKNIKISKENIPAATQLFTPDWIVRYMVENSLGRLWVEGHPNDSLKANWKYYLEEAEQEPEVQRQLADIRKDYSALTPEDLKCIDPCMGSGHILVYLFDVLMQIYESCGYTDRDAVRLILQNNLYGLDIDERAAQLAYFSVMMKARQYDRRFFSRGLQPHIYAIQESNGIGKDVIDYFVNSDAARKKAIDTIVAELRDAKEYGSILTVTPQDWSALYDRFDEIFDDFTLLREPALNQLLPLVQCAEAMAQKYLVTCTNPPYMGSSGMSTKMSDFVKKNYPDSKSDLFAVFIERCGEMTAKNGYQAMITQHAWMFLSSFEKLRSKLLQKDTVNMAHLGARAFEEIGGEVVQTTSFVLRKSHVANYKGTYCRLIEPTTQQGKEDMFLAGENRYTARQDNFSKIPGSPVAYWWRTFEIFDAPTIEKSYESAGRNKTHNNELYVRNWWEISDFERWKPYANGGVFRRWAGNDLDLVDWSDTAKAFYASHGGLYNQKYSGKQGICWNLITSYKNGFRLKKTTHHYSSGAPTIIAKTTASDEYLLAFLNCIVGYTLLNMFNPTLNTTVGDVLSLPLIVSSKELVTEISKENISISQFDWDSFETSWNFKRHPLVRPVSTIAEAFAAWSEECDTRFNQLKANEEELNRIFIDIYGLQDELTPQVEDKDVTVRKADLQRDVKSLISYAVGCMFGRYSLDVEGLAYAGGEWDAGKYTTFPADKDNIIPICDDEYFTDDIVNRFVNFIRIVYDEDTLEDNLKFIADALGGKGQPRDVIRNYFLNGFYADHCKTYQKRPIYWLFDSGKKNGFKALVYMHRYRPDTIARIRTDYVHEQQSRYRTAIADLEQRIANASTGERVKLNKQLAKLQAQADEIRVYEEKIHHLADRYISIDPDDGVKVNYAKFRDVLAKIK